MKYEKLIRQMTLAEKCAILSGKDEWHSRPVDRLEIPSFTMSDGPSGLRKQEGEGDHLGLNASTLATCMPSAATVACSWDEEIARSAGAVIGSEAATQNVQVLLGPGLNTKRSPLCGRNFEYFSEDPYLAGKLAASFIRGVEAQGVSACAKHFVANSQEDHRMSSDSVMDERTLRELYMTNFEIAIKEGKPRSIMTSYNLLNGTYTNENPHLLKDILRGEWGYQGAVITDWGGSNSYMEGVRAGMNLEMPGSGDDSAVQLIEAVKAGKIKESIIDQRVDELLTLNFTTAADKGKVKANLDENHAIAAKAAESTIVLLKNDEDILPLATSAKVAFIGDFVTTPRYQGAGSSMVNAYKVDNTADALKEFFPNCIGTAKGFQRLDVADEALAAEAEALAKQADVVVLYLGLTESFETEGLDRSHMKMPQNQIDLAARIAKVNSKVVVVLSAGSPVEMPWLNQCSGLLYGGLGGQAGARAMLKALSGQINPSGKLAETYPLTLESAPVTQYYPGKEKTSEYREGIYVGYRAYETAGIPVQFPFGFGLSYTTFAYSDLQVTDKGVTFSITNTGKVAGAEVAQLYISLPNAKIFRPSKELKGFTKVMLQPGETKTCSIAFDDKTFRYFNVKTNKWEVEPGTYSIQIGASVKNIVLQASLPVAGTKAPNPYEGKNLAAYQKCQLTAIPDDQFATILGRAIPQHNWDTNAPLEMNDAILQLYYAKSGLARFAGRKVKAMKDKSVAEGKPDLNLLFIYNIPFRAMAKMMGGMVSTKMAESILKMCNGHFWRGLGGLIGGFFSRPSLKKYEEKK